MVFVDIVNVPTPSTTLAFIRDNRTQPQDEITLLQKTDRNIDAPVVIPLIPQLWGEERLAYATNPRVTTFPDMEYTQIKIGQPLIGNAHGHSKDKTSLGYDRSGHFTIDTPIAKQFSSILKQ
jgi:hypothetical protein